jgi:hypothetical protein
MPYIENRRRRDFDDLIGKFYDIQNPGELNYVLTKIILSYIGDRPNYVIYADVLGTLEAIKSELYRRKIAPYENGKIKKNGDVY